MSIDELFANQITEEIKELARTRLLEGGNLAPRGCDRRKAKQSRWRRPGRSKTNIVGHGGAGQR